MLHKLFYTGPEKSVKILNFDRSFSEDTFDQVRINFAPNYSKFLYFQSVKKHISNNYKLLCYGT